LSPRTCRQHLTSLIKWLSWLEEHHVRSLSEVTQIHCDQFLQDAFVKHDPNGNPTGDANTPGSVAARVWVLQLVAIYGELFSTDRYQTGFTPWKARRPIPSPATSVLTAVRTACLIVTAAASGMRTSELLELRVGCRRPPRTVTGGGQRFRLASKVIKGRQFGGQDDEWVVVAEIDQAVALAERLRGGDIGEPVFGAMVFHTSYPRLRSWVNGPAGRRLGLAAIPAGPLNLRMLRRTLAQELAQRPGGLLAAKIHLKHVSTSEGYTNRPGGSQTRPAAPKPLTTPVTVQSGRSRPAPSRRSLATRESRKVSKPGCDASTTGSSGCSTASTRPPAPR
jgi:integrase